MKVALLQCNTVAGDVKGNAARIAAAVRRSAATGASLCVTSELALSGVAPRALLMASGFMEGCRQALQRLAEELADGPPVLVGAPVANPARSGKHASNAAVLLQKGVCRVISRKVFYSLGDDAQYFERGVSCGLMTLEGWRLGVVLCEDVWGSNSFWKIQHANAHNPLMELVTRGVDAIVHLAASPYVLEGQSTREHMLSHVAARHHVHLFSANLVGGNDDVVYHGQSLAFGPTGSLLARGKAFEEDVITVDTGGSPDRNNIAPACGCVEEECWKALVLGTRDYVRKCGVSRVALGLSGGMDSALVAAVAVEALGAENVRGVLLPSPYTSRESLEYAARLAANLGMETVTTAIAPIMTAFENVLDSVLAPPDESDVTFENIQARIRGSLLMAIANREGRMVLNTGNKSESAMGYCTLYGDAVGALGVIGDVPKTMVYRLARWYNEQKGRDVIPEAIIRRPPTAELRPGQLDSDAIPPYDVLDPIVERLMDPFVEEEADVEEPQALEDGVADAQRPDLENEVYARLCRSEFKRRQTPMALRVSRRAFGSGWRVPVVTHYSLPE